MEIILYIYITLAILIYVFIQLNYIFSWFKYSANDAMESLAVGALFAFFWPAALIIVAIWALANYMEKLHDTYKK